MASGRVELCHPLAAILCLPVSTHAAVGPKGARAFAWLPPLHLLLPLRAFAAALLLPLAAPGEGQRRRKSATVCGCGGEVFVF